MPFHHLQVIYNYRRVSKMNRKDVEKYWIPACARLLSEEMYDKHKLDELLGINEYGRYMNRAHAEDYPMSESLQQLLRSLAGPHGKTLLKVYRIKKGLEP